MVQDAGAPLKRKKMPWLGAGDGGSHHLLAGSWGAIGEGRTHPTSVYFQSKGMAIAPPKIQPHRLVFCNERY